MELDSHLLQVRQSLLAAIKYSSDCTEPLLELLYLPCPSAMKYAIIDVKDMLHNNCKNLKDLKNIPVALNILEKYGRHLLKPVTLRNELWRYVKFSNPIFRDRVDPLKGGRELMQLMGYTGEIQDGLYFPEPNEPNPDRTVNLVADLLLARKEMEMYLGGAHPQPTAISSVLPPKIITDVEMLRVGVSLSDLSPAPTRPAKAATATEQTKLLSGSEEAEISHKLCDICGDQTATMHCRSCDYKLLCAPCDQMWHTHPRRQNHQRDTTSHSVKKKQTNTIQGPYGIQARPGCDALLSSDTEEKTSQPNPQVLTLENSSGTAMSGPGMNGTDLTPLLPIQGPPRVDYAPLLTPLQDLGPLNEAKGQSVSQVVPEARVVELVYYPPDSILQAAHVTGRPSQLPPITHKPEHQSRASMILDEIKQERDLNKQVVKCTDNILRLGKEIDQVDDTIESLIKSNEYFFEDETFMKLNMDKGVLLRGKMLLEKYIEEVRSELSVRAGSDKTNKVSEHGGTSYENSGAPADPNIGTVHVLAQLPATVQRESVGLVDEHACHRWDFDQSTSLPRDPPTEPEAWRLENGKHGRESTGHSSRWQCEHCTVFNEAGTRICNVCHRTSDNPILLPPQVTPIPQVQAVVPKETPVSQSVLTGQQIGHKIAQEQDQVYHEKQEAHKRYREQSGRCVDIRYQEQNAEQQQFLDKKASREVMHQTCTSAVQSLTPETLNAGQSLTPGTLNAGQTLTPGTLNAGQSLTPGTLNAGQSLTPGPTNVGQSLGPGALDAGQTLQPEALNAGQSLEPGTLNADQSLRRGALNAGHNLLPATQGVTVPSKQPSFQETMEIINEQRHVKQMQLDGADLLQVVKSADRHGYDVEDIMVALEQCEHHSASAVEWLHGHWDALVESVVTMVTARSQDFEQNNIGMISTHEARIALQKNHGQVEEAAAYCINSRIKLYSGVNGEGVYAREDVLEAMYQLEGNKDLVVKHLDMMQLMPFKDRIWEKSETHDAMQLDLPATYSSVSTSIISHQDFQHRVCSQDIDIERRIRMVLVEGRLQSWGRAETVIKILEQDLAGLEENEYQCTLEDVVEAVRNCQDRHSSLVYLQRDCSICMSKFPMTKMMNLNICQCQMCRNCLRNYFDIAIKEKHVRNWTCPFCGLPDFNDDTVAADYLNLLGLMLKTIVEKDVQDLFETKVRDWHLQKDPNFRWCAHCGNGFLYQGWQDGQGQLSMTCQQCHKKTCFLCKKQWETQHEGLSCEEFEQWKVDNDPDNQAAGLARHLAESGIDCPSCKMRYSLAKGGCMHFKCPECAHEFCSGCSQPFYKQGGCTRYHQCVAQGLHCHHPRDCFFYLRDCEIEDLQKLLQSGRIPYNIEGGQQPTTCPVLEQKDGDIGSRKDEACGQNVETGHAGLCGTHYKEYLVGLINRHKLDPVHIMSHEQMLRLLSRMDLPEQIRKERESQTQFKRRLFEFIKEKVPLLR